MTKLIPLLLLAACNGSEPADDDTDTESATTGTIAVTFEIDADWRDAMDEPAIGRFWGDVYNADDVTGIGPDDGAEPYEGIYAELVDLTTGPSAVLWTSGELPAGWVTVLGFLDSDANADAESPEPDAQDPVTLPNENEFEVIAGAETEIAVHFGFLNP